MRTLLIIAATLALVSACATEKPGNDEHPEGPQVLSFGSNTSSITQGESVEISALVTDPNGMTDLVGGVLTDGEDGIYGNFNAVDDDGSYTITIGWELFHQLLPIQFDDGLIKRRVFATFYDTDGHTTTTETTIDLHCDGIGATDGVCGGLREGTWKVDGVVVYTNGCNFNTLALDGSQTELTRSGDAVHLFSEVTMRQHKLDLYGSGQWINDYNPTECLEQLDEVYDGVIYDVDSFEFDFKQTREQLFGSMCYMVELQEGFSYPCETRLKLMLRLL